MLAAIKDVLLAIMGVVVKPLAKLLARGAVSLVLMTKTKDDDKLLLEMSKNIMASLGTDE